MAYVVVVASFLGVKVCYTAYTSYRTTHHSRDVNPIHKNQLTSFLEVITLTFNYVAISCSLRLASQHYNNRLQLLYLFCSYIPTVECSTCQTHYTMHTVHNYI